MNSQKRPSETASVDRSWPIARQTTAASDCGPSAGFADRTQKAERFEVDPDQFQPGLSTRAHVTLDELAVCDDEQHAAVSDPCSSTLSARIR